MHREVSPLARLARHVCKALSPPSSMDRSRLEQLVVLGARFNHLKLATKGQRKLAPREGDFDRAISWVYERDGSVVITDQGLKTAGRCSMAVPWRAPNP
jgi:hypothetical protein